MITIIQLISSRVVALLIPYLMVNVSASNKVILEAVYSKLKTRDLFCHPYITETAWMLCLVLAFVTIMIVPG